ncbi:MAG: hypothetical protein HKM07_06150 [Chlamydiae bacterium]|nr:hypothetical protein [Chlamydiota bacterium]
MGNEKQKVKKQIKSLKEDRASESTNQPKLESTPFKVWKDENGEIQLIIDPSIQAEAGKSFNQLAGVKDSELARHIMCTGTNTIKSSISDQEKMNLVLQSLNDMKPKDSAEASLITQAAALYSQGMSYLEKAGKAERSDHIQCYGNLAAKLLRQHNETIETLSRYRRGGEQRVVIQHQQVNVSGQAQAVVGQFHTQGEGC